MAITYDFIVYIRRISETGWLLGMKAVQGEVPLDIVIPDEQNVSDSDDPKVVGVLTTEGLERESPDGLELYRYLREINPKKNDTFGYNEIVIRNIHTRLSTLEVGEEIRVQVTYNERREPYTLASYQMKLIGIFSNQEDTASPTEPQDEVDETDEIPDTPPPINRSGQSQIPNDIGPSGKPAYKTTNTLEKLIDFTQNLQKELAQTRKQLGVMINKVQHLEEKQQQFVDLQDAIQELYDRFDRLERLDGRIQDLEADRYQLEALQEALRKFFSGLHQQTRVVLHGYEDKTSDRTNERD